VAAGPNKASPGTGGEPPPPPRAPAAAGGVRLWRDLVDEQRSGGVEEDQGKENNGRRPWLGARESFSAAGLHWTTAARVVWEHEGAAARCGCIFLLRAHGTT
jgi:hypothetical protein